MNNVIFNSIMLHNKQIMYLTRGKAVTNRMKYLFQLMQFADGQIESSSNLNEVSSNLWQADISKISLAKLWQCRARHDKICLRTMVGTLSNLIFGRIPSLKLYNMTILFFFTKYVKSFLSKSHSFLGSKFSFPLHEKPFLV